MVAPSKWLSSVFTLGNMSNKVMEEKIKPNTTTTGHAQQCEPVTNEKTGLEIVGNEGVTKILKFLTIVKLLLGIIITILGISCSAVSRGQSCYIGRGIWVGIIAIISAVIGIAVTRKPNHRYLLFPYFVLCIVTSVFSVQLVIASSVYADKARFHSYYYSSSFDINVTLGLLAGIHSICAVIGGALICRIWSKQGWYIAAGQHERPPIIVIQTQPGFTTGTNNTAQAIVIKEGKTETVPVYVTQEKNNTMDNTLEE